MNREIKFRAWYSPEKRFVIMTLFKGGWCLEEDAIDTGELEDWQEYTGLKDKNGKEIYEGDLVKVDGQDIFNTEKYIQLVGMHNGCWRPTMMWVNGNTVEVIGNIYEHSHLLDNLC